MQLVGSELRLFHMFLLINPKRLKEQGIRGPDCKLRDWLVQESAAYFFHFPDAKCALTLRIRTQLQHYQAGLKSQSCVWSPLDGLPSYMKNSYNLIQSWPEHLEHPQHPNQNISLLFTVWMDIRWKNPKMYRKKVKVSIIQGWYLESMRS